MIFDSLNTLCCPYCQAKFDIMENFGIAKSKMYSEYFCPNRHLSIYYDNSILIRKIEDISDILGTIAINTDETMNLFFGNWNVRLYNVPIFDLFQFSQEELYQKLKLLQTYS